jgi:vacuolar-type H+-ATPase subunit E/Vma4
VTSSFEKLLLVKIRMECSGQIDLNTRETQWSINKGAEGRGEILEDRIRREIFTMTNCFRWSCSA